MTLTDRRPEGVVEQPHSGDDRPPPASVADAEPAREQEKTFRLTLRNAVYGDLLGAPGGGDFSSREWDAKSTTVRKMREAVANAVLATWQAEDGERPRPNRLHWENIHLLLVPEGRRPPSPSTLSRPNPSAAEEDDPLQEAANPIEPTIRDSVSSVCRSDSDFFDTDVLLEDDGGKALLFDALHAHGAREVQSDTEMANAGAPFEVKYFVRTFEPFARKDDVQKALALWLLQEAAPHFMRHPIRLEDAGHRARLNIGAVAAQCNALRGEQRDIEEKYGPVRIWDLSLLSDLSDLLPHCGVVATKKRLGERYPDLLQTCVPPGHQFSRLCQFFTADVSGWDVSGATNLRHMFNGCAEFNCDVGAWDVSKVENFAGMFFFCTKFDQDLTSWNVGNGVDFCGMFRGCLKFNQTLAAWNVGNGVDFCDMFASCEKFDQDLAAWNVGKGVNFHSMFYRCRLFNRDLDPWDVAKAEAMGMMFAECDAFSQPLASWNVGKVKSFRMMFLGCVKFNQPVDSWDVSSAIDFRGMFQNCAEFAQDLRAWKVSKEAQADNMFAGCARFSPGLSPWNIAGPRRARMFGCQDTDSAVETETPKSENVPHGDDDGGDEDGD